ncbi:S-adenosyl-L-methionine-dependent methyltransferase [Dichotomopilus funicola]|uniref:tRNA wybutosine-synthesizing protein 4 n=1 Tax=Dichotomopilus funicola TaxID=1934379 RepID=A0AAN6ZN56_9PEZI|nr:S-adenosyl-L-methionine-dependent methyltransferase [Dichotomopilus funicola]
MGKKPKPAPNGEAGLVKSAQAKAQDDQVMATNNSSIVSKRSVEKLYYPTEPPFFRHFVAKFQRRAPLINRGYWLRLRVIDVLVRDFLRGVQRRGKRGVVINLGCGSDVLPWQCLTRYADSCAGVKFVDVDFPDLIERKRRTVLATPELLGMLTGVKGADFKDGAADLPKPVVFDSNQYAQIGCDLRELTTLWKGLEAMAGSLEECEFIFVAEVSITYMEREGADQVISWASGIGNAEFVLLEQILPDGEHHPFASTMLSHFGKLNTQLKAVGTYPTVAHQHTRFSSSGWDSAKVWTLWQAWADETFLSPAERLALDDIEPFDEWEEFALFASHYCVVHAKVGSGNDVSAVPAPLIPSGSEFPVEPARLQFDECAGTRGQRRFAAAMQLSHPGAKTPSVLNILGLGTKARLQSYDVFSQDEPGVGIPSMTFAGGAPSTRMCHSLTDLGDNGVLLAGGRGSPTNPLKDCWLFNKTANTWEPTHDLPTPLHRHAVTALRASGLALLLGGRGERGAWDGCLVYHADNGWTSCEVLGEGKPAAVYGATLACQSGGDMGHFRGIYLGGLQDGLISRQALSWEVDKPTIKFTPLKIIGDTQGEASWLLTRFGATCFTHVNEFLIIGGVARDHLLSNQDEVVLCSLWGDELRITRRLASQSYKETSIPRPMFVGHSAVRIANESIVVVGGGATCFSMGTFWNKGVYHLRLPGADKMVPAPALPWVHERAVEVIPTQRGLPIAPRQQGNHEPAEPTPIPRLRLGTADDFAKVVRAGRPVVLEGLDMGSCVANWTSDYLVDKVGADREIVIHESASQAMDFTAKNFRYVTTGFGEFTQRVDKGDKLYLRALSHEKPTEHPALLAEDFPSLAPDFVLPPQLSLVEENLFSSVLRMSGPVNMWLHYDVMANVYCQISGSKRLLLFPPSDVEHFPFAPGASSSGIDVFSSLGSPELIHTRPHEAMVSPGDVLFLPPLWLHTATPTSDKSIAVNVFFKDLENVLYAPGRDVYGNRDLGAYEKGRQDVARIVNSFKKLPAEAREFYLLRLANELRGKARG